MIEISPRITRLKPFKKSHRKISIETEISLVKDYYEGGMSRSALAKKYQLSGSNTDKILSKYTGDRRDFGSAPEGEPPNEQERILLVSESQMEFIAFLLTEHAMDYRIPKKYKYTEEIPSKLCQE